MNQISFKGMVCAGTLSRLPRISLIALLLSFIVTDASAQYCGFSEPNYFRPGTALGAVSRSPGLVDVFATDANGCVFRVAWSPYSGGFWEWQPVNFYLGWQNMDLSSPVMAISRGTDKIDIFGTDYSDNVTTAAWDPADGWHGWWPIGASSGYCVGPCSSNVTGVSRSTDKLDIFWIGSDGQVYTAAWQPGFSNFKGPWPIPGVQATPTSSVAVVSRVTDFLDIFVIDANGAVQTASWEPGFPSWTRWKQLPGVRGAIGTTVPLPTSITALKRGTNLVHLFLTDVNGNIQTATVFPGFGGWNQIGIADPGAVISGVSRRPGRLDVFVSVGGSVWQNGWEPDLPGWIEWTIIPGFEIENSSSIAAVSRSLDTIDLFAVANDFTLWTAAWQPASGNQWSVYQLPVPMTPCASPLPGVAVRLNTMKTQGVPEGCIRAAVAKLLF